MSQPKKQKVNITNRQLLSRLKRLPIVQQLTIPELLAYIGLLLVNKGNPISVAQGARIIKHSKLDKKIKYNMHIPCLNVLEAIIYLVILKRELINEFIKHEELPIWNDEISAPLFDIMKEISEIYKV